MDASSLRHHLQEWSHAGSLSQATLSSEGLSFEGVTLPRDQKISVNNHEYTVASIYLQILNPNQKLMEYRNACKTHQVNDPVRPADKAALLELFAAGDAAVAASTTATAASQGATTETKHDKREKDRKQRHKEKRAEPATQSKPKKKAKAVSNEELFSNLAEVVDKRQEGNDPQRLEQQPQQHQQELALALSTEGFEQGLTPQLVEEFRRQLIPEIPVGNSASILRAANPRKDLSRVLEILQETTSGTSKRPSKTPTAPPKKVKTYLKGKNPVIIVPKGMTTPITLANAHDFLANSKFHAGLRRATPQTPTTFTRALRNGQPVEYEIMDNPRKMLGSNPQEWERIVAVLVLGQSWQFKGWLPGYESPVDLFEKTFGFYIGMEGDNIPTEVSGWKVGRAHLNRDKRGLDSVTYASFWNGLEEWMAIKKPELLPSNE